VHSLNDVLRARSIARPVSIRRLGESIGLTIPMSVIELIRRLA